MANTLSLLQPTLFSAAQEVSNEPFGVIDSMSQDFDDKGVARGDSVTVAVAPTLPLTDFIPANVPSQGADTVADALTVQISASKKAEWYLTAEQQRSLQNGADDKEWARQLLIQGMRSLRNQAEIDGATAVKIGAGLGYGTPGTVPFATDLSAITNIRKILRDNGAPMQDLQMVIDTNAALNLQNLGIIQQAYQAGSDEERRQGKFLKQFGFAIRDSAGIQLHTKGTGASYAVSGAVAKGGTSVALITGTGTINPGDLVTFSGNANYKYGIRTGIAAPGTLVLNRPGARPLAGIANAETVALANNYMPHLAFERSAVVAVMRPPLIPENPTIKRMLVSDKFGMTYLLLEIAQYGQVKWELHLAWGFKVVQPEHVVVLVG
jgi:hypothetical protein